jgi:hypothetical protein
MQVSDPHNQPATWTSAHEALRERASRLEETRKANLALARARVVLHEGNLGVQETRREFEAEKQRANASHTPIDPRFASWVAWEIGVIPYHEALRAMYPPETKDLIAALAARKTDAIEWALVFLEADPRCFRAGYLRERMLRYLGRMVDLLSAGDTQRLRIVALAAVDDPWRPTPFDLEEATVRAGGYGARFMARFGAQLAYGKRRTLPLAQRREFKWYCRLAAKIDGESLERELEVRARSDDAVVARRAALMLGAIAQKREPAPQA